jgi:hypothetical protein
MFVFLDALRARQLFILRFDFYGLQKVIFTFTLYDLGIRSLLPMQGGAAGLVFNQRQEPGSSPSTLLLLALKNQQEGARLEWHCRAYRVIFCHRGAHR